MTTNKLAGADAARHGTGDADLTIMLAAHEALRRDLVGLSRATAGAARSVLDAMEAEHEQIDPLLAAVSQAMDASEQDGVDHDGGRLADTVDVLTMALHGHLAHEERDALPLIGTALTAAEWRAVGRRIGVRNLRRAPEMFAWMLDGATPDQAGAATAQLPPPARVLYRTVWRPRFVRRPRW